jgi:hypothetical protein
MQLPVERAAVFLADRLSRSRAAASGLPCGRRCAIGFAVLDPVATRQDSGACDEAGKSRKRSFPQLSAAQMFTSR